MTAIHGSYDRRELEQAGKIETYKALVGRPKKEFIPTVQVNMDCTDDLMRYLMRAYRHLVHIFIEILQEDEWRILDDMRKWIEMGFKF